MTIGINTGIGIGGITRQGAHVKPDFVVIGSQRWKKVNHDSALTVMGETIPESSSENWTGLVVPSMISYNNDAALAVIYGKMYNYLGIKKLHDDIVAYNRLHQTALIKYDIARDVDYELLIEELGGVAVAGGKLKESGLDHWASPNTGATNESKFTGLPGGYVESNGGFANLGNSIFIATRTESSATDVKMYYLYKDNAALTLFPYAKTCGYYIRFTESKPLVGDVIVLGDSTVASYLGYNPISTYLDVYDTLTDVSVPGEHISEQLIRYNNLSTEIKGAAKYVFVQVGLNDVSKTGIYDEPTANKIARYQSMIDSIVIGSPNAKIIAATMTPAKQRYIDMRGEVDGMIDYQIWLDLNYAIEHTITGVYAVANAHTSALNDGNGNLLAKYDYSDHVHENNIGRNIVANSWYSKI